MERRVGDANKPRPLQPFQPLCRGPRNSRPACRIPQIKFSTTSGLRQDRRSFALACMTGVPLPKGGKGGGTAQRSGRTGKPSSTTTQGDRPRRPGPMAAAPAVPQGNPVTSGSSRQPAGRIWEARRDPIVISQLPNREFTGWRFNAASPSVPSSGGLGYCTRSQDSGHHHS